MSFWKPATPQRTVVDTASGGGGEVVIVGRPRVFPSGQHSTPLRDLADQYAAALADPSHAGLERCRTLEPELAGPLGARSDGDRQSYTQLVRQLDQAEAMERAHQTQPADVTRAERHEADLRRQLEELRARHEIASTELKRLRGLPSERNWLRQQITTLAAMRPAVQYALRERLAALGFTLSLPRL